MLDKTEFRHPEKRHHTPNPYQRKPEWIRVKAPVGKGYRETLDVVQSQKLSTVCQEASCPNIGECWEKKHATFMILGNICTRACAFCNVATGKPNGWVDEDEPIRVAKAVATMGLTHSVITSVDRDDLPDGGADHFAKVIKAIRTLSPHTTIEVLTPDFRGKVDAIKKVVAAKPDLFNHNLETVPRLYPSIRPGARYFTSLALLQSVRNMDNDIFTKSGLMVGLGEDFNEVAQVMDDARAAGVEFLTIGQYLAPTPKHAKVIKFWHPDEFKQLEQTAIGKGFSMVSASALTRSSYLAGDDFAKLKANRHQSTGY